MSNLGDHLAESLAARQEDSIARFKQAQKIINSEQARTPRERKYKCTSFSLYSEDNELFNQIRARACHFGVIMSRSDVLRSAIRELAATDDARFEAAIGELKD